MVPDAPILASSVSQPSFHLSSTSASVNNQLFGGGREHARFAQIYTAATEAQCGLCLVCVLIVCF